MKWIIASVAALVLPASGLEAAPSPNGCDAACSGQLANRYADALTKRGASAALPWAKRVRYSENNVPLMVDDGIWATVTARGPGPLIVADTSADRVVWIGEAQEHGQPAYLAFRMQLTGRAIADVAAVIRRKEGRPPFSDPAAMSFAKDFSASLPAAARNTRARLADIVARYFAALVKTDPRYRLAADCVHVENGVADPDGCGGRFRPDRSGDVEAVRGLEFSAIDQARGLVAVMGTRDYSARPPLAASADARFPHSYAFTAIFKLENGAITRIQEVSSPVPYRMPTRADAR